MSTIEKLKNLQSNLEERLRDTDAYGGEIDGMFNEIIVELEAPKTCETCKYSGYFSPHDSLECLNNDCNFYSCDVDLDDGCNKHEPKDTL